MGKCAQIRTTVHKHERICTTVLDGEAVQAVAPACVGGEAVQAVALACVGGEAVQAVTLPVSVAKPCRP